MLLKLSLIFLIVLTFAAASFAQTQGCPVTKGLKGKYKVSYSDSAVVEGRKILFLHIKIGKNKFTDDYLRQVARRLRETYCGEENLNIAILDASDNRRFDDLTPPPPFPPRTRAVYGLDRKSGKEELYYWVSEKMGAPIKIDR